MRAIPSLRPAAFALSLWLGAAARACPPALPGEAPRALNDLERAQAIAASPNIVYGVVTRSAGWSARFRIIHVYKGPLRPGAVIEVQSGWGLDGPPCIGTALPSPIPDDTYGVVFFETSRPELNFVEEHDLAILFREGLIRSARAGGPARH